MARRLSAHDHDGDLRRRARLVERRLKATVPSQWARSIEALAQHEPGCPVWMRAGDWVARLERFRAEHGGAIVWHMCDTEICTRARAIADSVGDLMTLWPDPLAEPERLDVVRAACAAVGVDDPVAVTAAGAINRGLSHVWWRRVLRKKVARMVEHGAIKLGLVNRAAGGYASNGAVDRRLAQVARNEAMMKKTLIKNEAGQVYSLSELAALSVANRDVRRGELMTRIRGCEEFADDAGHVGVFFTLTCPSRFHSVMAPPRGSRAAPRRNPRYDGSSPRDAQLWLCDMWARARAKIGREGLVMYGFRVAEPHHDACPHWHALLWFADAAAAERAGAIVREYWLSDDGAAPGARKNRVNIKRMERGGAAGYIAKYIAKNVGGSYDVGGHLDGTGGDQADAFGVESGAVQGFQRVDAWAGTWGIRQFQPIGQPPVTVWRELRRVTHDQAEQARIDGERAAWQAWGAVQRQGDIMACWKRYLLAMGGVCRKRGEWAMKTAARVVDSVSQYGEDVTRKITVGIELASGRWLVSRRQSWAHVSEGAQAPESRASMARPWTGFNNCTARITHNLRRAFMGRGRHEASDWAGCAAA